jgi:hypothetical protein
MTIPRLLRVAVVGLGLLAGGAALGASEEDPAIAVRLPRSTFNLRLSGPDIVAPHVQLTREGDELRGRIASGPTKLKLKDGKLSGTVGNGAFINLKARVEGDTLHGEGGFLGSPSKVRLNRSELHVYVNSCTYDLKAEGNRYVGKRSCDSALMPPTEVSLPAALQSYSPVEQVLLLLLALG